MNRVSQDNSGLLLARELVLCYSPHALASFVWVNHGSIVYRNLAEWDKQIQIHNKGLNLARFHKTVKMFFFFVVDKYQLSQ